MFVFVVLDALLLGLNTQLKQRTKQRSTEIKICLHNVRALRNKTKDVNALLEVDEISSRVFIEMWIKKNSDDGFILKQCCRPGFSSIVHPRLIKRGGGICHLLQM